MSTIGAPVVPEPVEDGAARASAGAAQATDHQAAPWAPPILDLIAPEDPGSSGSAVPTQGVRNREPPHEERFPVPGTGPEPGTAPGPALYYDVAAMLDGTLPEPPEPEVLTRSDGRGIFYAGQVNLVFGDPESGKTFIALAAGAECLARGGRLLVLDLDHGGPASTVARLLMLGAPLAALRDGDRFRYVEPEDRWHVLAVVEDVQAWRPDVAVVDSVGELLPVFGASSNSPDDYTAVHTTVIKPLATAGAAVICVDHLAKNTDSRAQGATGTAAKRRTVGGVSLRVRLADTFVPGRGGSAQLLIHKDRHGGLRAHSPTEDREPVAGTFVLTTDAGATTWRVVAPATTDRNPDEAASRADLAAVAALDPPARTVSDLAERLQWRKQRAAAVLREHRRTAVPSSAPPVWEPGTAACAACGEPMSVLEAGQDTHPGCDPAAA